MALPATDNFNGGILGEQLTSYSANWTLCMGDFDIQKEGADALGPDSATYSGAGWNADAFNNNQYAEATIVALSVIYIYIGVAVRCDVGTPDDDFYLFVTDSTDGCYLEKIINGANTQLGSAGSALNVNDVIRIEASGTTITPKVNGSEEDPPGAQTDSSLSSGAAGVAGYDDGEDCRIDNWEGGNLAAGPSGIKTINTLAIASVKTINDEPIAEVKTINDAS